MSPVQILLITLAVYMALGCAFGAWFVLLGVGRIDAIAADTPFRVRVLFFPGSVALWPLLASKCFASNRSTEAQS